MGLSWLQGFLSADLFKAIVLVAALAGSIIVTINLTYNPPPPRPFSFREAVPSQGSSITLSDIIGNIFATTWSQPDVLINGTITVTGEGSTPDNVQLHELNTGGSISFQPVYNDMTPGRSYLVNVNIYLPSNIAFESVAISEKGGGAIRLDPLNASRIDVSSWTGNIAMTLNPIRTGDYRIATYNGGSIDLKIPAESSFKLDATSGYGYYGEVTVHGFQPCTIQYSPNRYAPGNTGATITCGDQSAYITVQTGYVGGVLLTGDITISSI